MDSIATRVCGSKKGQILGIAPAASANEVLITLKSGEIQIFNVKQQEQTHSWTTKPGHNFATRVVLHTTAKKCVCFEEKSTACVWDFESIGEDNKGEHISFEQAKRKKLEKVVVDVIVPTSTAQESNNAVILVFADGSLSALDLIALKTTTLFVGSKATNVKFSGLIRSDENALILYTIIKQKNNFALRIFTIPTQGDVTQTSVELAANGRTIVASSYDESANRLSLIWSDGQWDKYEISAQLAVTKSAFLRLRGFTCFDNAANTEASFIATAFHKDYIALIGVQSSDDKPIATIWDTKFGTLQAQIAFPTGSGEDESFDGLSAITASKSSTSAILCISSCKAVYTIAVGCPPITTASLFSKKDNRQFVIDEKEGQQRAAVVINARDLLKDKGNDTIEAVKNIVEQAEQKNKRLLGTLLDTTKTPTYDEFMKTFNEAIKEPGALSVFFVNKVAQRCVASSFFAAPSASANAETKAPLKALLETGLVSSSECPTLLPSILANNQFELLELYLNKVRDISEANLVQIMHYLFCDAPEDKLEQYKEQREAKTSASGAASWLKFRRNGDAPIEPFLCMITMQEINDLFMASQLQTLPPEEICAFIHFLTKWFKRYDCSRKIALGVSMYEPSLEQVIAWTKVVLDAQFANMIVMSDLFAQAVHDLTYTCNVVMKQAEANETHIALSMAALQKAAAKIPKQHVVEQTEQRRKNRPTYSVNVISL